MKIVIKTIPHKKQRYPTVGDYWVDKRGTFQIRVSRFGKRGWKYELLIAVHELIEQVLCLDRGIKEKAITAFDIQFEEESRQGCKHQTEEPGDDPRAPYIKEHKFATLVESILARELDVDWKRYERAIERL